MQIDQFTGLRSAQMFNGKGKRCKSEEGNITWGREGKQRNGSIRKMKTETGDDPMDFEAKWK